MKKEQRVNVNDAIMDAEARGDVLGSARSPTGMPLSRSQIKDDTIVRAMGATMKASQAEALGVLEKTADGYRLATVSTEGGSTD